MNNILISAYDLCNYITKCNFMVLKSIYYIKFTKVFKLHFKKALYTVIL